jgi:putative cardiolipin synthase
MDVLLAGEVVDGLAAIFDIYWNSPHAYSVTSIVGESGEPHQRRARFNHEVDVGEQMRSVAVPPMDMLGQRPLGVELDAGRLSLAVGKAVAFSDEPGKVTATSAEKARAMSVQMNVMDRVARSARRVVISSPYLVPGAVGVRTFAELTKRGVEVTILPNSLAANDVPLAHIGYAAYRAGLLRAGVDLYELRPSGFRDRGWDAIPSLSHGRLHAKVAVIDDAVVYIGSMNLDPRSESTNTELGVVVHSPELASDVVRVIDAAKRESSYGVRFSRDGTSLEWLVMGDADGLVLSSEPNVRPFVQFRNKLLKLFVPEQLL